MGEEVGEVKWDEAIEILRSLMGSVDTAMTELCEMRFFKGCSEMNAKVMPLLKELLSDAEKGIERYEPEEEEEGLPERGEGLVRGTAGERRAGVQRTEEERRARHEEEEEEEETYQEKVKRERLELRRDSLEDM